MNKHVELVRKLLTKAERSPFQAEQEAFRTKALELIERHGITIEELTPSAPQPLVFTQGPVMGFVFNFGVGYYMGATGTTSFNVTANTGVW